jgi:multicomponent Na+:H+ antiporter subunit C
METIFALLVGALYAAAVFAMLSRSIVRLAIGLTLLTQATNLLIFTIGRLKSGHPPLIPGQAKVLAPPYADPLPQALVLTAIVISFGILAFTIVLIYRTHETLQTDDTHQMEETES